MHKKLKGKNERPNKNQPTRSRCVKRTNSTRVNTSGIIRNFKISSDYKISSISILEKLIRTKILINFRTNVLLKTLQLSKLKIVYGYSVSKTKSNFDLGLFVASNDSDYSNTLEEVFYDAA